MPQIDKQQGFTILESLMAIAVLAMIGMLGLPELGSIYRNRAGELMLLQVAESIAYARTVAAESGHTATLCPSADGRQCGGKWHQGILLFQDINRDHRIQDDEPVAHFLQFANTSGTLRWRSFQNRQYLQITARGFTYYQNGNFTWCGSGPGSRSGKQLIINSVGRARFARDSDGDGFPEDSQGDPVVCSL